MNLPSVSVKHKIPVFMLIMVIIVFGIINFFDIGLDLFPEMEFPAVSVITTYSGASSHDVEQSLTRYIERWVASVKNVKKVSSVSQEGISMVMIEFDWDTNMDFAAQDVRDAISMFEPMLPDHASKPIVFKFNISDLPILMYGITGNLDVHDLLDYIEDNIIMRFQRVDGVASAQVFAETKKEIMVKISLPALHSYNIALDQVVMAIGLNNTNAPAGFIHEAHREYILRTLGEYSELSDIADVVVGAGNYGVPIYLKDIASVDWGEKEVRSRLRVNSEKGIFMMISKSSDANAVNVAKGIIDVVAEIEENNPYQIKFHTFFDQSRAISMIINKTTDNILLGGLFAVILLFIFLGSIRPTLIISLSIPLSIIATFLAIKLAGYTFNLITMIGLGLGIGMLVDNSIVVLENIFRNAELGKNIHDSSIDGASEVGMAITASTLTTVAVFFPMILAKGITGKLVRPMALTITFSLICSLFVAITIIPMFSDIFLRKINTASLAKNNRSRMFGLKPFFMKSLYKVLHNRGKFIIAVLLLFGLSLAIIPFIGTEFMPKMDRSMILMKVSLPIGTRLEETDKILSMMSEKFRSLPGVIAISEQAGINEEWAQDAASEMSPRGPHQGTIWLYLDELDNRPYRDLEMVDMVERMMPELSNVDIEMIDLGQAMGGGTVFPVEIKVFGRDLDKLKDITDRIAVSIRAVDGIRDVRTGLEEGKPEIQLVINKKKANSYGLSSYQISNIIQTATIGSIAQRYRKAGSEWDIRVILDKKHRNTVEDILQIPITAPGGNRVMLGTVVDVNEGIGPLTIERENQVRVVKVTANIIGRDLGSVVSDVQRIIERDIKPTINDGYDIVYGGQYEDMVDTFIILIGALALAVLLVYMVMSSQFENLLYPFIIMFTIPLAFIGVSFILLITGRPINLPVFVGLIILTGIAVNNGIVMVDYINRLRRQKHIEDFKAIITGASVRLRPILITALTTSMGMVPMMLSTSEGAEMRSAIALVMVAGLATTTLLTLYFIPCLYTLFSRIKPEELELTDLD